VQRILTLIAGALLALALAAPAAAQDKTVAPPGNSGVDEYLEVVPGAGGDTPASGGTSGTSQSQTPRSALGAKTATELSRLGADGRKAAELAAAGAPTDRKTARKRAKGRVLGEQAEQGKPITAAGGGGRVGTIATALSGEGGGMGLLFPLLLGGTLVLALALVIGRRIARR
jgi:opacity protein-like surface antigen